MSPDRLQQIETIYNDALALKPGDRAAFLDRVCTGDADLNRLSLSHVRQFHRVAIENGGTDEAAPGIRQNYNANYYGGVRW